MQLAINGGAPVRSKPWPKWPCYAPIVQTHLMAVLESGRWAISGPWMGESSYCRRFEESFASFNRASYCVATDHGSSSVLIALEALGVGAGDEVIVPALTWVATASAVVNVNATPVFVDVDADTLCISPEAIAAAITSRTKAVIPVHLHYLMADMDVIIALAKQHEIAVLEDCAQAHGAKWNGQCAGTIGNVGAFSMQHGKVLTSGEGGAVITNSLELYTRLQQLRADSRIWSDTVPTVGEMELIESGQIMGTNYCLSEFHAAVLLGQLEFLAEQNATREKNVIYLNEQLLELGAYRPLIIPKRQDGLSVYEYAVRIKQEVFETQTLEVICKALSAELGFPVYSTDVPLPDNILYNPSTKKRFHWSVDYLHSIHPKDLYIPNARKAHSETIVFHHPVLLGSKEDIDDIIAAFSKVFSLKESLPT